MKLCMNCKHFVPAPQEEFCRCAMITVISPISGYQAGIYCVIERLSIVGDCGQDGKLFEPRKEVA